MTVQPVEIEAGSLASGPIHGERLAYRLGPDAAGGDLRMRWPPGDATDAVLRITVAREQWDIARLELTTTDGVVAASAPVDHSDAFEHVDIALAASVVAAVGARGGRLRVADGHEPLVIFGQNTPWSPRLVTAPAGDVPDPREALLGALASPLSLQAFGWKLGCVLDGLADLHRMTGEARFVDRMRSHLAEYLDDRGTLTYQDPWGGVRHDEIYGIEGMLPLVGLARTEQREHALRLCATHAARARRADGAVADTGVLTTEGMYTVAYPLAVLGELADDQSMLDDAAHQLRVRIPALHVDGVRLRRYDDGSIEFPNWIRAWTWSLLGLARTLPILRGRTVTHDLEAEFAQLAQRALELRGPDLLWTTYPREPSTPVETSGSAGLAAALAIGARSGLLPLARLDDARETQARLMDYVGPEGLLGGASQANKDGERLQRSPRRVNSQVGMGLLGQLIAHTW